MPQKPGTKPGKTMEVIMRAIAVVLSLMFTLTVQAEEARSVVFTEDTHLEGGEDAHLIVDEIYFDAGECVVYVYYADGAAPLTDERGISFVYYIAGGSPGEWKSEAQIRQIASKICWPQEDEPAPRAIT